MIRTQNLEVVKRPTKSAHELVDAIHVLTLCQLLERGLVFWLRSLAGSARP
jgi:hypothetical protein